MINPIPCSLASKLVYKSKTTWLVILREHQPSPFWEDIHSWAKRGLQVRGILFNRSLQHRNLNLKARFIPHSVCSSFSGLVRQPETSWSGFWSDLVLGAQEAAQGLACSRTLFSFHLSGEKSVLFSRAPVPHGLREKAETLPVLLFSEFRVRVPSLVSFSSSRKLQFVKLQAQPCTRRGYRWHPRHTGTSSEPVSRRESLL